MNIDASGSLLHLMRLVSPALPVGAYVYSQGLETAVDQGWVHDSDSTKDWLLGNLSYGIGYLDAPVFIRLYDAWENNDYQAINYWNQFLQASLETAEFLLEDTQMGAALLRLVQDLVGQSSWPEAAPTSVSFASVFAFYAVHWRVEKSLALQGLLWSWLENQVAAAIKLVPLGQTQGQRLLVDLTSTIQSTQQQAECITDTEIGWSLPRLAMASMRHECQYTRLFRS